MNNAVPCPRNRGCYGFSLVEVMVSICILAMVLLYVIGVFTTGMRANRKSVDLTAGILVAESVLTHEMHGILNYDSDKRNAMFSDSASSSEPFVTGTQHINNTVFTYKIFVSNVGSADDIFNKTSNHLKKVDVQVWWWNDSIATDGSTTTSGTGTEADRAKSFRDGYGVLSVGLTRLINEQSNY